MFKKKFKRFLVSKVCDVERLKEFSTRLSLAQIVIRFLDVKIIPQGSVSKFPSSSKRGKFMIRVSDVGVVSIRERSFASKQLFNKS